MATPVPDLRELATRLENQLRGQGTAGRAAGAKAYLKSDLDFLGVDTPTLRRSCKELLYELPQLGRGHLLALVDELWWRRIFELRAAGTELLSARVDLLEAEDLAFLERLLRDAHSWALVDALAPRVVGPLVVREAARHPGLYATLDRWARDEDFWLRRASLLFDLLPLRRGEGDWERFARYADALLEDREVLVRKAIGWVLREVGKRRPELVTEWLLAPRRSPLAPGGSVARAVPASGLTLREAVKYLPAKDRAAILCAHAARA